MNTRLHAMAEILANAMTGATGILTGEVTGNTFEMDDTEGRRYVVTVDSLYVPTEGPTDTEIWQQCPDRDVYASVAEHRRGCGAHTDTLDEVEIDDDNDDDERPADPEAFDGGYGNGSYFQHAMRKDCE